MATRLALVVALIGGAGCHDAPATLCWENVSPDGKYAVDAFSQGSTGFAMPGDGGCEYDDGFVRLRRVSDGRELARRPQRDLIGRVDWWPDAVSIVGEQGGTWRLPP